MALVRVYYKLYFAGPFMWSCTEETDRCIVTSFKLTPEAEAGLTITNWRRFLNAVIY